MSRPFDARRDGFICAEGGAALVLEDLDHARRRGARIYGELLGAGSTADAHHITAPAPGGNGAAACMELALADAGVTPDRDRPHQRPRHLDPAQRPGRGPGHREGVRFTPAPRHLHQGSHRPRAGRGRRHRGRGHALTIDRRLIPPTAGYEQPDPEIHLDVVHGQARDVGACAGAVELLRLRRPQRLPGHRSCPSMNGRARPAPWNGRGTIPSTR